MLKNWQFNILFFVAVGGVVLLLVGPDGIVDRSPTAAMGVGTILTFILTQKSALTKIDDKSKKENESKEEEQ